MQAVKSLARTAPRSFVQSARLSTRTYGSAFATRSWTPVFNAASRSAARFSTSQPRFETGEELAAKLQSEITYEQDLQAEQPENSSVKGFLTESEFQIEDVDGSEEVHLVRSYGDEQIKVTFSCESYSNPEAELDPSTDSALYDEGSPSTEKARPSESEDGMEEYDDTPSAYQVQVTVQVTRQGKGALVLSTFLDQDARFNIEHVAYFPTAEMAEGSTAEAELSKRGVYTGPPFEELDEGLQEMFHEYLNERGINDAMAVFIPTYLDMKESQEYVRWMQNVAKFVE